MEQATGACRDSEWKIDDRPKNRSNVGERQMHASRPFPKTGAVKRRCDQ
jgi:hypothetical protein